MVKIVGNTAEMRSQNKKKIIQHVIRTPEKTRKQISDAVGLSFATISNLTTQMIEEGILLSESSEQSQGGRIPGLISVNPRACCSICIDLSDNNCAYVSLVNLNGQALERMSLANCAEWPYEDLIARCRETAEALLKACDLSKSSIIGIGVSVPGILDIKRDILVNATHARLEGRPLRADIARFFDPLPCYVGNEANLTALSLAQATKGAILKDIICLYLDEGLGIGIITEGQLLVGSHGFGGEINHWRLGGSRGYSCYCGKKGCLETELSKSGFLRKYAELKPDSTVDWPEFVRRVHEGEAEALNVVRENGLLIGILLNDLQMLFDPEACWIGGAVADIYDQLFPHFRGYLDYDDPSFPQLPVHRVDNPQDAIQRGCQCLVFESWNP